MNARAVIDRPRAQTLLEALDRVLARAAAARKRRLLRPIERKLTAAMAKAFQAQGRAFLRRFAKLAAEFPSVEGSPAASPMEEAVRERDWGPLFDEAALETLSLFVDPIDEFTAAALAAGARAQIAELGLDMSFKLANPRAVAYLKDYGAKLVKGIDETTREEIKRIVTRGVDEGWSYDKTAKAISQRFEEFRVGKPQQHVDSRAHLVAITESANAYESGSRIVIDDLIEAGLTMEHSWLTVGDDRVSDGCRANQAQGWILATEDFQSGHSHPPRFPGCRCCALYRRQPGGKAA